MKGNSSGLVAQSVCWIEVFLQIIEGALRRSLVFVTPGREKKAPKVL